MMKNKFNISVLVYMKKKFAYTEREDQIEAFAKKLGGKNVGGGTDLTTGKRDQQFYFKDIKDAKTFLKAPSVKESILADVDVINIQE